MPELPAEAAEQFAQAVAAQRDGQLTTAERTYRAILEQWPDHAATLTNLGRIAKVRGRIDDAVDLYRRATQQPDVAPAAYFNLGVTHIERGDMEQGLSALRECAARAPEWFPVQRQLGLSLLRLGEPRQAITWLRKALRQDSKSTQLWRALGQAAEETGDTKVAAEAYRRAIALAGELGATGIRLARLMWENDQQAQALDILRKLVEENPETADCWANLGYAALGSHLYDEALRCYRKVADIDPDYPEAKESVAKCLVNLGRLNEAYEILEGLVNVPEPRAMAARGYLMALLYDPVISPQEKLSKHKLLTAPWTKGIRELKTTRREPGERLRVGYLTADLAGTHPVAQFVGPLLRAHRGHRIDSIVYDSGAPAKLAEGQMQDVAHVRTVGELDDRGLAKTIAADNLDLLIDLSGHTQGTRLAVMAYRPAPVQACFIGYPHSTGFGPVDYLIADPIVAPESAERLVSERIARLPHAFLCFVPPQSMPRPNPRKPVGPVVFGSLNHLPKITEPTLALWAKVLDAVPDSRLLMKCAAFREDEARNRYRRHFAAKGIADNRLTLEGPEPFAQAMRAYDRIDIALDTMPYNGGTTTCHALWMGVPVVTLAGDNFCGRMGASFLNAAGCSELIATDELDFVDIASRLTGNVQDLVRLKTSIRETLPDSPLCDIQSYASDVAELYRHIAWSNQPSRDISG